MSLPKRLKALQGLWIEDNRKAGPKKKWLVEESLAWQQFDDGTYGKSYTIATTPGGDIVWGKGNYVLDYTFKSGDAIATWWVGDNVGFAWRRLEKSEGKGEKKGGKEAKEGKGGKEGKTGKGKVVVKDGKGETTGSGGKDAKTGKEGKVGKGGNSSHGVEKRFAEDGVAYTLDEMMAYYAYTFNTPKIETTMYWLQCEKVSDSKAKEKTPAKGTGKAVPTDSLEERIDPADGEAYTLAAMKEYYSKIYTKFAVEAYWGECKVKAQGKGGKAEGERRIDPSDGKTYTWEELRAHYSSEYTKKQAAEFWENMKVATDGGKGKDKGKGKEKGKEKGKGKSSK